MTFCMLKATSLDFCMGVRLSRPRYVGNDVEARFWVTEPKMSIQTINAINGRYLCQGLPLFLLYDGEECTSEKVDPPILAV